MKHQIKKLLLTLIIYVPMTSPGIAQSEYEPRKPRMCIPLINCDQTKNANGSETSKENSIPSKYLQQVFL